MYIPLLLPYILLPYISSFCDSAARSALSISTTCPSAFASMLTPHVCPSSPPSPSASRNGNHIISSTQPQPSSPLTPTTLHSLPPSETPSPLAPSTLHSLPPRRPFTSREPGVGGVIAPTPGEPLYLFLNKNQTTVEWRPHWYRLLQGHKIYLQSHKH